MELKDVVKTVALLGVVGVFIYAMVKDIDRTDTQVRARGGRKSDPFWESATERDRISALQEALRNEKDPEVRKELAKQLGNQSFVAA
jgi:ABC-type branched-subunit amino acid transport system substrate-binding protein